jgi:Family of unknown function (DUF6334)
MTDERLDTLSEMAYEAGCLKQVDYLLQEDSLVAVILTFEYRIFTVLVIASDDTIELFSGACYPAVKYNLISVTEKEPWLRAIGKKIIWAWDLINQQGYADSIQFYFANVDSEKSSIFSEEDVIIQLITVASSLKTYKLNQIKY